MILELTEDITDRHMHLGRGFAPGEHDKAAILEDLLEIGPNALIGERIPVHARDRGAPGELIAQIANLNTGHAVLLLRLSSRPSPDSYAVIIPKSRGLCSP